MIIDILELDKMYLDIFFITKKIKYKRKIYVKNYKK